MKKAFSFLCGIFLVGSLYSAQDQGPNEEPLPHLELEPEWVGYSIKIENEQLDVLEAQDDEFSEIQQKGMFHASRFRDLLIANIFNNLNKLEHSWAINESYEYFNFLNSVQSLFKKEIRTEMARNRVTPTYTHYLSCAYCELFEKDFGNSDLLNEALAQLEEGLSRDVSDAEKVELIQLMYGFSAFEALKNGPQLSDEAVKNAVQYVENASKKYEATENVIFSFKEYARNPSLAEQRYDAFKEQPEVMDYLEWAAPALKTSLGLERDLIPAESVLLAEIFLKIAVIDEINIDKIPMCYFDQMLELAVLIIQNRIEGYTDL